MRTTPKKRKTKTKEMTKKNSALRRNSPAGTFLCEKVVQSRKIKEGMVTLSS